MECSKFWLPLPPSLWCGGSSVVSSSRPVNRPPPLIRTLKFPPLAGAIPKTAPVPLPSKNPTTTNSQLPTPTHYNVPLPTDAQFMSQALDLASTGIALCSPNPYVGALLVDSGGNIVGRGSYRYDA